MKIIDASEISAKAEDRDFQRFMLVLATRAAARICDKELKQTTEEVMLDMSITLVHSAFAVLANPSDHFSGKLLMAQLTGYVDAAKELIKQAPNEGVGGRPASTH